VRKGEQPPWIVSDELWARIEPLLPVRPRRFRSLGRHRLPDRLVLQGILFVLPAELRAADRLDWSRTVIDSSHVRAARRGPKAARARSTAPGRAPSTTS
jgi:transposase